jgi:F0F1-type ATP synthase assembly protein I
MKFGKFFKYYLIATQGLSTILVLTFGGLLIGWAIDKESIWPPILAVIGLLIGLVSFIGYLLKYQNKIDKTKQIKKVKESEES